MNAELQLVACLSRLAQYQNVSIDRLTLQEAVTSSEVSGDAKTALKLVARCLNIKTPKRYKSADPADMPALLMTTAGDWAVLRGLNAQNQWVIENWNQTTHSWQEQSSDALSDWQIFGISMAQAFDARKSQIYRLIRDELFSQKALLYSAALAGVIINSAALATSFYTMQVYDRVVPTAATQTLLVLSLGVFFAILYELFAKNIRCKISDRLIDHVDQRLARAVYLRFLNVRLDQLPKSVGSLASQMRGYETVRSVLTAVTSRLLIDAPFALLFVLVIYSIAGSLAFIPLTFFLFSLLLGLYFSARVDDLANNANAASNFKTGLLVESVEGAETIKSGQGGWRMLSRWMNTTDEARDYETKIRNVSEYSQHLTATFQQLSYVGLVASGALMVSSGQLTMGGLLACSIISGRILAPVASIPSILVQWGHAKAALKGLDALWALQDDHFNQKQPVVLEAITGDYRLESVAASYGEQTALQVAKLHIQAGEKVAVLGPIGAGKTTLLRILSGMYKPQSGRVLLDSVDLAHISKPVLAEQIGFVQQEARLFAGTLRENLTLGLLDPGDEAILDAARITGLLDAVITPHPSGLQRQIYEGGTGLSGGQRQLVTLTRTFLRKPGIWLLDEPTASMDKNLQVKVTKALVEALQPQHSLVLVTHKPEMLSLVERVIVIANNRVVMDGPKEQVMQKLAGGAKQAVEKTP